MNNSDLRYFITVVECGSYSKAAESLYSSQSNISYHIRQLENEMGFSLFRQDNRIELSAAGKIIYEKAVQQHEEWQNTLHNAREVAMGQRLELHVGIRRMLNNNAVADIIREFYRIQSEYGVVMHDYRIGRFTQDLMQGNRDILFATSDEVADCPELSYCRLGTAFQGYAVSIDHPLAGRKSLSMDELKGERLILPAAFQGRHDGTHIPMLERIRANNRISYSDSHDNAIISAAAGIAIASMCYVEAEMPDRVVLIPAEEIPEISFGVAWRTDTENQGIRDFVRVAKEIYHTEA